MGSTLAVPHRPCSHPAAPLSVAESNHRKQAGAGSTAPTSTGGVVNPIFLTGSDKPQLESIYIALGRKRTSNGHELTLQSVNLKETHDKNHGRDETAFILLTWVHLGHSCRPKHAQSSLGHSVLKILLGHGRSVTCQRMRKLIDYL